MKFYFILEEFLSYDYIDEIRYQISDNESIYSILNTLALFNFGEWNGKYYKIRTNDIVVAEIENNTVRVYKTDKRKLYEELAKIRETDLQKLKEFLYEVLA